MWNLKSNIFHILGKSWNFVHDFFFIRGFDLNVDFKIAPQKRGKGHSLAAGADQSILL